MAQRIILYNGFTKLSNRRIAAEPRGTHTGVLWASYRAASSSLRMRLLWLPCGLIPDSHRLAETSPGSHTYLCGFQGANLGHLLQP